ncbi:MAG TPA: MBL fold metallo-hydrolase [Acidimicrobiales bacterium]|nr:MBL fold metallo-hydrolase [Acidimicrobiales bacterium]
MARDSDTSIKVTVLGCAGSSYDEALRLPCSSYLLESSEIALLLDCGFGTFDSYVLHAPTTRIDAIFLSHAHGDHVGDLEAFMNATDLWRHQPRLITSEKTMSLIVREPDSLPEGTLTLVGDGTHVEFARFEMDFSLTTHQMPTLAACVSIGGRRVVYSADTGPTWSIPPSFVGAELAIVECTLETRDESSSLFHLDAGETGKMVRDLRAPRAMISHIPPLESGIGRLAIARDVAPNVNFFLATTGLQVKLI